MTDKQIIIDGVDVSGCEYYNKDDKTCREVNGNYDTDICEFDKCKNSNCCYKQLKRKEQECEELKKELMKKDEVDTFFNTPIEGWSNDPCEICKYKQTLTEIKEIAEIINDRTMVASYICDHLDKILQKISEVLND